MTAAAGSATGCFKCGRSGHWSSDCPFKPASETAAASPPVAATQGSYPIQRGTQQYTQGYKRKEPWGKSASRSGSFVPREKPVKAPVPPRRMPRLTPDLLLGAGGLGYVLEKIPRQVTIKGRGHEVDDLKSLLEAYVRWHQTLLPYYSYSQFVEKVEKVGSTKRVRMCVRELRSKIERGENPTLESESQCDDAPDTRWEENDSDAEEDHGDPPVDVVEQYVREATTVPVSIQADAAPASSSRPTLVIGQELITVGQEEIKDDQRARMEANKQKALERGRARKLELGKATSTAPA